MAEERVQRRLAAILAADVVGYSRLIAADEVGTLARFRQIRVNVIDPTIAQFQGHIVGAAGDSLLVEFSNALAAVECAVACQRELIRRNASELEYRRISFRMGVNLGDVIAADDTIHGDGVNIASRLEKLAEPDGLCIARNVFEQVESKLDLTFTDLGEHPVKNIAKPIRVYRAEITGQLPSAAEPGVGVKNLTHAEKVSIAILPFDNMSGDPDQGYFSDGITEDIITELSRFRELQVVARNSSFIFRGSTVDVKEVAQKLGVQFVVEGSVRKIGNRVRVTAQLIDAASTAHVWAERYDRDLTDIFEIQDEITRTVVARVAGHAKSALVHRNRSRPTQNLSAYDCYLRARELYGDSESLRQAESLLLKAIELDPNFATAHALLSIRGTGKYLNDGQKERLENALTIGQKALALDSEEPWASFAVGSALIYLRRLDEAVRYFDRAIALNPNDVQFLAMHALCMNFMGQSESALREIEEALRREPYAYQWFWGVRGSILTTQGRYRDAIQSFHRMKSPRPWSQCYLAICQVELGQIAEAQTCLKKFRIVVSAMTPEDIIANEPYDDAATSKHLIDAVRRAGPAAQN